MTWQKPNPTLHNSPKLWESLKYFKVDGSDQFGEPFLIHPYLLILLDSLRAEIRTPLHITCGTQGMHTPNSQHYAGLAVDFVLPQYKNSHLDMIYKIMNFPFTGIGFYPDWYYKSESNIIGGYHVDIRPKLESESRDMWIGVKSNPQLKNSATKYLPFTYLNMVDALSRAHLQTMR